MWSDRISPDRQKALAEEIGSVLPGATPDATFTRTPLKTHASLEQAAQLLHTRSGFAYLRSGPSGPCLLFDPVATLSYRNGIASIQGPNRCIGVAGPGLDVLASLLEATQGVARETNQASLPTSLPLLAGFLGYDLATELEDLGDYPAPDFAFPELRFGLYDSALVYAEGAWTLEQANWWGTSISPDTAEELLRQAAQIDGTPTIPASRGPFFSTPDHKGFEAAVARTVATIHAGDIFQTNLCRRIETELEADRAWDLFRRLREISPARYEAFLRITDVGDAVLSISPEMYLKVTSEGGRRTVESQPIKGTRARGLTEAVDQALASELLNSDKDRAELAMIVDVVRNDLSRVCEIGSVEVAEHAALMTLPTVHHSVSTVRGRLRADASLIDLIRASFPAASISGAPKIEAMHVALREEQQRRGPAMGAIGWISPGTSLSGGTMEFSVAIRTAFVTGGKVRYYAGCGITADSVPADEFQESRHKAAAFVDALGRRDESGW